MVAWKTQVGAKDRATDVPFEPSSSVPKSNVWDAIEYVYDTLAASASALAATVAALATLLKSKSYLISATDADLPNAVIPTSTTTIAWDFSAANQAKASVPDGSLVFGKLNTAVYDTDGTLAANSDTRLPTQKAVKTYADAIVTLFTGALVFKGAFDASAGVFPGGGSAKLGYFYRCSVAGTVGGQAFDVGDDLYALVNNASSTVYAANWLLIEGVLSSAEIVLALAANALALGKLAQGTALSVLGVTGNTGANYADIAAASDKQVLRRAGTAVAFGAIDLTSSAAASGVLQAACAPILSGAIQNAGGVAATTSVVDLVFVIGDGQNAITAGVYGFLPVDFPGAILGYTLIGDAAGNLVVDVRQKAGLGNVPGSGDTIVASAPPTLSSSQIVNSTTLTGWTTVFTPGSFQVAVTGTPATVKQATLSIKVQKTG